MPLPSRSTSSSSIAIPLPSSGSETVVVTTGNDNVNLYLAHLLSRIYEVPEIVVRFDDPKYEELIKDLPGVKAVYPFQLSFEKILSCKEEMEAGK